MFIPENGRASSSGIDKEGRFQLGCYEANDGALPGRHAVKVTAIEPIDAHSRRWLAPRNTPTTTPRGWK